MRIVIQTEARAMGGIENENMLMYDYWKFLLKLDSSLATKFVSGQEVEFTEVRGAQVYTTRVKLERKETQG